MNTEFFIDEIHIEPFAKTPRMVFADWLEENGDLRAAVVREFAQHVKDSGSYRPSHLLNNIDLDPLPRIKDIRWGDWIGGFPTGVVAKSVSVLHHNIVKIVDSIDLKHIRINPKGDARHEYWQTPYGYFEQGEIAQLADLVQEHQVPWLDIDYCQLRKKDRTFILESGKFACLRRFTSMGTRWSFDEVQSMLNHNDFVNLQKVRVPKSRFSKHFRKLLGDRVISAKKSIFPTRFWFNESGNAGSKPTPAPGDEPTPRPRSEPSSESENANLLSRLWTRLYRS